MESEQIRITRSKTRKYPLAWYPNENPGRIFLGIENDIGQRRRQEVAVSSAGEFAAMAAVLNQSPVYLNDDTGVISGVDEVGE